MRNPSRLVLPGFAVLAGGVVAALPSGVTPAAAQSGALKCQKGYQFYEEGRQVLRRTEPTQRNTNKTRRTLTARFISHQSHTVTKSVNVAVEAEASAGWGPLSASIKSSFNREIVREQTAEIGNEQEVKIPPRSAGVGRYGVYMRTFKGVYGRAKKRSDKFPPLLDRPYPNGCKLIFFPVTAKVPTPAVGWEVSIKRL